MECTDVIVVGGGPAGAAAAMTLARRGLGVVLLDKARFPRDKQCGDGLTTGALRLLDQLGLDPHGVASWQPVQDVLVRSPSGRLVRFPLPRSAGQFAAVARRHDLDAAVLDLARSAGADVRDGVGSANVTEFEDRVMVTTDGGRRIASRYLVAADGAWSGVRKHLGLGAPGYRGEWYALRQYVEGTSHRAGEDLIVFFEPDVLPGYVWSFPLPGRTANIGFGVVQGGKVPTSAMSRLWDDILTRPHVRELLGSDVRSTGAPRTWPIPAAVDAVPLTGQRTLFVGDAARAADPLTGEGIAQALITGRLAAEALMTAGPTDATAARQRYERGVRHALFADHRMSMVLGGALRHRKGARAAVRLAGTTRWTRTNFARWLFEDYPRAYLVTPRRWRPDGLRGSGAFVR